MTIQVNFIEGNRRSICNNDAYAVVQDNRLVTIFPASILREKGVSSDDLKNAFTQAAEKIVCENPQKRAARQELYARKLLGL